MVVGCLVELLSLLDFLVIIFGQTAQKEDHPGKVQRRARRSVGCLQYMNHQLDRRQVSGQSCKYTRNCNCSSFVNMCVWAYVCGVEKHRTYTTIDLEVLAGDVILITFVSESIVYACVFVK